MWRNRMRKTALHGNDLLLIWFDNGSRSLCDSVYVSQRIPHGYSKAKACAKSKPDLQLREGMNLLVDAYASVSRTVESRY